MDGDRTSRRNVRVTDQVVAWLQRGDLVVGRTPAKKVRTTGER
jgi:hypothetical protein